MTAEAERLRAEVDALKAENEKLRQSGADMPSPATVSRQRWRAWLSGTCIVLVALLVPLSIVGGWTRAQLVDEQRFVETLAPLSSDPNVQQLVIDRVSVAIDERIDIAGMTDSLFDGLATLNLPSSAQSALRLLRAPAAAGARSVVTNAITGVVRSDAFAAVWQQSLVLTHRALVAAAGDGSASAVTVTGGEIGIQLGPIVALIRTTLLDQGFALASAIPAVDTTIVLAQSDTLALIRPAYTITVAVGYLLPLVAVALLLAGVLVARRRSSAVLGAGLALTLGAGATAVALSVGGLVVGVRAPGLGIPATTAEGVYTTLVERMQQTSITLVVLGIVLAAAAWIAGRGEGAVRVRTFAAAVTGGARRALQRRGLSTGSFGHWLYAQRVLVRILLLVLAIATMFVAPLSVAAVVWIVVLGLLVWLVSELLSVHPGDLEWAAQPSTPVGPVDGSPTEP